MILRHSLVSCIDQVKDKGMSQDCELTLAGAIHAKSTNVGRGHLTDFIKLECGFGWSIRISLSNIRFF